MPKDGSADNAGNSYSSYTTKTKDYYDNFGYSSHLNADQKAKAPVIMPKPSTLPSSSSYNLQSAQLSKPSNNPSFFETLMNNNNPSLPQFNDFVPPTNQETMHFNQSNIKVDEGKVDEETVFIGGAEIISSSNAGEEKTSGKKSLKRSFDESFPSAMNPMTYPNSNPQSNQMSSFYGGSSVPISMPPSFPMYSSPSPHYQNPMMTNNNFYGG